MSPMASMLKKGLMHIFNAVNHFRRDGDMRLVDSLDGKLVKSVSGMPPAVCDDFVVFGAAEISAAVATRAAEMIAQGVLRPGGTIYLTGGVDPVWKDRKVNKVGLLKKMTDAGLPAPEPGEVEAPYMARVLRARLEELGVDPREYRFVCEAESGNAQENVRNVAKLGAGRDESRLMGFVAHPAYVLRTIGTWRKEHPGNKSPIRPLLAWIPEIGATAEGWKKSALACFFVVLEGRKYLLPTPETSEFVAKRKFANAVDLRAETDRLLDAYCDRDPVAAIAWARERGMTVPMLRQDGSGNSPKLMI